MLYVHGIPGCLGGLTWLQCCSATVLGFARHVVVRRALVLWAEVLQGPVKKCVNDPHSQPKQGLQEPQLWPNILQAVLNHNHRCHDLQLARHSLRSVHCKIWLQLLGLSSVGLKFCVAPLAQEETSSLECMAWDEQYWSVLLHVA